LAEALEAADSDAVRQAAHSIKGGAANAGGPQLSQTARKLEQLGAQGDFAQAAGLMPELEKSVERLRPRMRRFCDEPDAR
jgi:HPt (histidine-containing phosphotransfer) domain-containing protein